MIFDDKDIQAYKRKHGDIYLIEVEEFSCLLRTPTRKDLSYVGVLKDPMQATEAMLRQLWVAGDEEIKERDDLFMAVAGKMDAVLAVKEATIKKL